MRWKKFIFRIAQIVIIAVIFFFIISNLIENWNAVKQYKWEINYFWLIFSFLLVFLAFALLVLVWREVLKTSGFAPPFGRIFRAWFLSNLGRYLPGKVWQFLGMVYLLEKEGVSVQRSFYTMILSQTMSVVSGLILAVAFLGHELYFKLNFGWSILIPTVILLLGFLILLIFPRVLIGLVNFALKTLKKQMVDFDLKRKDILRFFVFYIFCWFFFGLSFFLLVKSITPIGWNLYFSLTASFSGSMIIGFLALFAPGGIGVREGILAGILSIYFPAGIPALISLLSRIWITLVEIICFLIGLTIGSSSKR